MNSDQQQNLQQQKHNQIKQDTTFCGQCYCGAVKFEVKTNPAPIQSMFCHCDSCRRAHSAPLYHIVYVPKECFTLVEGKDSITEFSKKEGSPIRAFCKVCGSKIYNIIPEKPILGTGFFPSLLSEKDQSNLPQAFKPKYHYLSHEAVVELSKLEDGLPRV